MTCASSRSCTALSAAHWMLMIVRLLLQHILEREVSRFESEHIIPGTALGELDHPNYASKYFKCLNLPNISHQVRSLLAWVFVLDHLARLHRSSLWVGVGLPATPVRWNTAAMAVKQWGPGCEGQGARQARHPSKVLREGVGKGSRGRRLDLPVGLQRAPAKRSPAGRRCGWQAEAIPEAAIQLRPGAFGFWCGGWQPPACMARVQRLAAAAVVLEEPPHGQAAVAQGGALHGDTMKRKTIRMSKSCCCRLMARQPCGPGTGRGFSHSPDPQQLLP